MAKQRKHDWHHVILTAGKWFFSLAAVAFAVLFVIETIETCVFVRHAAHAAGVITELTETQGNDGPSYAPVFAFNAQDGSRHLVHSNFSTNPPSFYAGEQVSILYSATAPQSARISTTGQTWGLSILFFVFAALALGAAAFFRWRARKRVLMMGRLNKLRRLELALERPENTGLRDQVHAAIRSESVDPNT